MATDTWNGSTGADWFTASNWGGGTAPQTGDTVFINSGTVDVAGSEEDQEVNSATGDFGTELDPINGEQITLGATAAGTTAAIQATEALFAYSDTLVSTGSDAYAAFDAIGPTGFAGTLIASAPGGTLTINATQADGGQAAEFVLLHGGSMSASDGDDVVLNGSFAIESNLSIAAGATLTNDGVVGLFDGSVSLVSGSFLNGTGTFLAGPDDTMDLDAAVPSTQTIRFDGPGRINIGDLAGFAAPITNFTAGAEIDLLGLVANYATYNATTGTLTVDDIVSGNTTLVASLQLQGPASGIFQTETDGTGGTILRLPSTVADGRISYEAETAAEAIGANIVNQMTLAGGAPINGAGIKVGIISDSLNATIVSDGTTYSNLMQDAITDQLLPASGVTILQDSTIAGMEDEGLAMAELVHEIAPGATIYFASAYNGGTASTQTAMAGAVASLVAAGVNVIANDFSNKNAPFFQVAGPGDTEIESAVANDGVNFFTDTANYGSSSYFQAAWNPTTTQLVKAPNGSPQTVSAQEFDNGTPYQTISVPGSIDTTIDLQWNAAWPSTGNGDPDLVGMTLYNSTGTAVAESTQVIDGSDGYDGIPEIQLTVPDSGTTQTYQLSIWQAGGSAPGQFKYVLFGSPAGANDPGGTIDDPAAGLGSGSENGYALVPGVNTVGAEYWANSAAFGNPPNWTEYFSSPGPGQLLFNQAGTAINQIADVPSFIAPDGIETSVPGFQVFSGSSAATPDAAAIAALMLQVNPNLTTSQIASILASTATSMNLPPADQGAGMVNALAAVEAVMCFAAGTRIATATGQVPVEHLRAGDRVHLALEDEMMTIEWIGRRSVDCTRHPRPETVWPVSVAAGALGPGRPHRELLLSPDHAIYFEGVLIPVKHLIDGETIRPVPVDRVVYYHIELESHQVILANGLPVESLLDQDGRDQFDNSGQPMRLIADFASGRLDVATSWEARACAPLVVSGPLLRKARARIASHAGSTPSLHRRGRHLTSDPNVRLDTDQEAAAWVEGGDGAWDDNAVRFVYVAP